MRPNHRKFADEYLRTGCAAEAYRLAYPGVKNNTAAANGEKLLRNTDVAAYIGERMAAQDAARVASADEVLEYLTKVLRRRTRSEVVVVEGAGVGVSQARRVRKAPDERDRLKAAELLGKYHSIYNERLRIEAEIPVYVKDDFEKRGGDDDELF